HATHTSPPPTYTLSLHDALPICDGFQEYQTYSPLGYENVNWKDSDDSVVYADGSQVKQPKGTCELQGYVYDAKVRMAEIFQVLGDRKSTRLNSSHGSISYAVFCL